MKRLSPRQGLLAGLLGLSLAATAWVASREEPEAPPVAPRRKLAAATAAAVPTDWPGPPARAREAWPEPDGIAYRAWGDAPAAPSAPPAPVVTASVEPAPEEAAIPPFPYRLVGRMTDSQARVVLDGPQRSLVLGVNDVADGQWRIEAIEATGLRVKHLPDGPSQFIAFSSP